MRQYRKQNLIFICSEYDLCELRLENMDYVCNQYVWPIYGDFLRILFSLKFYPLKSIFGNRMNFVLGYQILLR